MTYNVQDLTRTIPGDVGFTLTHGAGRYTIPWGQAFIGDGSVWEHTFLCLGNGAAIEARPPRARIFQTQLDDDVLYYRLPLTTEQRLFLSTQPWLDFHDHEIRYSWLAYLNMGLLRMGVRPEFIKRNVESSPRKICSQLVDKYLTDSGMDVLEGVFPGEVSPGDLAFRFANDPACQPFRLDGAPTWHRPVR